MQTKTTRKLLGSALVCFLLSACGGGAGTSAVPQQSSSSDNTSTSSSSASSVDAVTFKEIGYGSGDSFAKGAIGVGIDSNNLSAGGTTTLTVNLVSATHTLVTQSLTVTFNSKCVAAQKATLSATQVSTVTGEATVTYTANGCVGDDLVTATVNGTETAQTTLNIAQDTIQSVTYIEAKPTQISLHGTGGTETSTVKFQVLGSTGAPIEGIQVNFSLNTQVGGLALTKTTDKTDSSGYVSTSVNSGTIATSVRVTAVANDTNIATQSSQLIVSTGIPDQKSMSLSTDIFNPAGWNQDNISTKFTISLADAFNNFAPDGTAVSFTTEGGAIESGCTTTKGTCTVTWRSQEPRPTRADSDYSVNTILCKGMSGSTLSACEAKRAGRITVLATAIGNESFIDVDGDGYYTKGVDIFNTGGNCTANVPLSSQNANATDSKSTTACDDLPEAYLDKNESGTRENNENFVDFNNDQTYNASNHLYDGILCNDPLEITCTKNSVTIRKQLVIVMACNTPLVTSSNLLPDQLANITLALGESKTNTMELADCNGNSLPAGTTVDINTSSATDVTVTSSLAAAIPNSINWTTLSLTYKNSDTKLAKGNVYLNVNVPVGASKITTTIGPITLN